MELLITIVIAGIVFAGMVPFFYNALGTSSREKVRLAALNVAQDKIEKIRQLDFDQITRPNLESVATTTTWQYASEFGPSWTSDQGRQFDVFYWVKESANSKQVFVTVDWTAPASRVPNSFSYAPDESGHVDYVLPKLTEPRFGVTLSTIIYRQYGGAQVIDLNMIPDTASGVLTWDSATHGALTLVVQAVLNPVDDNLTTAFRAEFKGLTGTDAQPQDGKVSTRDPGSGRFQMTWSPTTDGSTDGIYRPEVTVYSAAGNPGNSYAEEFRLESGPPSPAQQPSASSGDAVVSLTWVKSPTADVASYEVWRRDVTDTPDATFSKVAEHLVNTVYVDTAAQTPTGQPGVQNLRKYEYYVIAVDWMRNASDPSSTAAGNPHAPFDATAPPPPAVTNVPVPRMARLTWPDVVDPTVAGEDTTGIDHYIVTRNDGALTSILSPKTPGLTVEFAEGITESHSYTVAAWDAAGNRSTPVGPIQVTYTLPIHSLTVSANKSNVSYTVRDGNNVSVGTGSGRSFTWSLPEGTYYVIATRNGVTRGPVTVRLDVDTTLTPSFVF